MFAATIIALPVAAASPATGEQNSPVPYILMGVGLAALVAVLVLTMAGKKKKDPPSVHPSESQENRRNDDVQGPAGPQS